MPDPKVTLGLVFVVYGEYSSLDSFLADCAPLDERVRIVIVDNTEHDRLDAAQLARWESEHAVETLVAEPENLGYFGGAEFAIEKVPELGECDYIAIANTDLAFDPGAFREELEEKRAEHAGVGAIAPRLTHADGSEKAQLHYVKKPSRRKYERLTRIYSHYPLAVAHRAVGDLKRSAGRGRDHGPTPRKIFAPHGALIILTREYFEKTAGFNYAGFLFCEEVFVGHECEQAGLGCIYEPALTYSHENHGAMGARPSRRIVALLRDSHALTAPLLD